MSADHLIEGLVRVYLVLGANGKWGIDPLELNGHPLDAPPARCGCTDPDGCEAAASGVPMPTAGQLRDLLIEATGGVTAAGELRDQADRLLSIPGMGRVARDLHARADELDPQGGAR